VISDADKNGSSADLGWIILTLESRALARSNFHNQKALRTLRIRKKRQVLERYAVAKDWATRWRFLCHVEPSFLLLPHSSWVTQRFPPRLWRLEVALAAAAPSMAQPFVVAALLTEAAPIVVASVAVMPIEAAATGAAAAGTPASRPEPRSAPLLPVRQPQARTTTGHSADMIHIRRAN
jgi:hypothetical protein